MSTRERSGGWKDYEEKSLRPKTPHKGKGRQDDKGKWLNVWEDEDENDSEPKKQN